MDIVQIIPWKDTYCHGLYVLMEDGRLLRGQWDHHKQGFSWMEVKVPE